MTKKAGKAKKASSSFAKATEDKKVSRVKSSSVFKGEPQTMEELMKSVGQEIHAWRRGDTVTGKITAIHGRQVYVEVGTKAEGIIANREQETARDFIKSLKVGDEITCQVLSPEIEGGYLLLSLKKAATGSVWKQLTEAKEKGEEIEVQVQQVIRGGLLVSFLGISGFIPGSQLGQALQENLAELSSAGQKLKVKVVEIDEAQEKLIFSEKAVSEKEKIAQVAKALEKIRKLQSVDKLRDY